MNILHFLFPLKNNTRLPTRFSKTYFKLFSNGSRKHRKKSPWILTCTDYNHILYCEEFLSLSLDGKGKANLMPISKVFCVFHFLSGSLNFVQATEK